MCVRALSRSSCSVSCPSLHGAHLDVRARHRVNIIPGMQKYLAVVLIRGSHSRCLGLDGCLWNGDPSRPRAAKSSFSVPGLCGVSWDLIECAMRIIRITNDNRLIVGESLQQHVEFQINTIMQESDDATRGHPERFFRILPPRLRTNPQSGHPPLTQRPREILRIVTQCG